MYRLFHQHYFEVAANGATTEISITAVVQEGRAVSPERVTVPRTLHIQREESK